MTEETYLLEGMGCSHCTVKVRQALLKVPHVLSAEVSLELQQATITADADIPESDIRKAVAGAGHYEVAGKRPS